MGRRDQVLEQIRSEAREDFLSNPGPVPSVEQMRQVGDVLRPAIARARESKRGAA